MVRHTTWPAPLQRPGIKAAGSRLADVRPSDGTSFRDALRQATSNKDVKFSAHATDRLRSRQIAVTSEQRARLRGALDTASAKGARESLVLMDDLALVVSVPNRTVITVARQADLAEKMFTGIDSAMVLAGTNDKT
ncbi:MAG: flagellar biosynthesis protein [Candidatus Hydrogenedentes bacterium]|nr:flagellar biosynthesis protein [Candidatus Hydrogenedentota bacterium]